jgi:organic hydroperoxide reductase OsmC/OhrA
MSHHAVTIHWARAEGEVFTDKRYHRRHVWHFDHGTDVIGSSSPSVVRPPYSDPAAVDPEEAFVASVSSCHMLWFLDFACRAGLRVDDYEDEAVGEVGDMGDGRFGFRRVTLQPRVRFGDGAAPDRATLDRLHEQSHEHCFIANSVKCEIACEPRVD